MDHKRSVYDMLKNNLQLTKRNTFIHRLIYMGEHNNESELEAAFISTIKSVNEEILDEKVTGLFLLYPNYFINVLDGAEYGIGRFVIRMDRLYGHLMTKVKVLCFYHHINQRFFGQWAVRHAKPPILLEKIDPASNFDELKRHVQICITKIYNLAIELRKPDEENPEYIKVGEIKQYMNQYLPEYNLLSYILNENQMYDISFLVKIMDNVLDTRYILEQVWPARNNFIPYNVFEAEKNPIQNIKEEEEENI